LPTILLEQNLGSARIFIWLDDARRSVVVRVQNEAGEEKMTFEIVKAWPCKYDPSDLNATGTATLRI